MLIAVSCPFFLSFLNLVTELYFYLKIVLQESNLQKEELSTNFQGEM